MEGVGAGVRGQEGSSGIVRSGCVDEEDVGGGTAGSGV